MLLEGESLLAACEAIEAVFLLQDIITCALQAMPSCLVPCDSPALLKALASIIRLMPARNPAFVTKEAFAVPIHQVRFTAQSASFWICCNECVAYKLTYVFILAGCSAAAT